MGRHRRDLHLSRPATVAVYAQLHAMPGLYADNGGFDLGGPMEFRSGIELGYENREAAGAMR